MPTLEEIPLPSGLGFLSPLPWALEFDGFRMRDSAAGSSFAMTAGPADQGAPALTWEGWQGRGARHRMSSRRERKHPTGQLCGPKMVKQQPDGQRPACLEVVSEQGEVLLFLAYLQLYL